MFDVGALLEDAETKNAALERVEELEENISHVSASQRGKCTGIQDELMLPWMVGSGRVYSGGIISFWASEPSNSLWVFKEGRYVSGETFALFPLKSCSISPKSHALAILVASTEE